MPGGSSWRAAECVSATRLHPGRRAGDRAGDPHGRWHGDRPGPRLIGPPVLLPAVEGLAATRAGCNATAAWEARPVWRVGRVDSPTAAGAPGATTAWRPPGGCEGNRDQTATGPSIPCRWPRARWRHGAQGLIWVEGAGHFALADRRDLGPRPSVARCGMRTHPDETLLTHSWGRQGTSGGHGSGSVREPAPRGPKAHLEKQSQVSSGRSGQIRPGDGSHWSESD